MNAWINRGEAYAKLEQWDKVIADLTKAIELNSSYVNAWIDRGKAHAKLGLWDKEIADFTKAIELGPKNAELYNDLAWRLATCGNPELRDPRRSAARLGQGSRLAPTAPKRRQLPDYAGRGSIPRRRLASGDCGT